MRKIPFILLLTILCTQVKAFSPENEYIFEVRLVEGIVVHDSLIAYQENQSWHLSFIDITRALGFDISYSSQLEQASGSIVNSQSLFELDLKKCQVIIEGVNQKFDCNKVKVYEEELFVDKELLEKWFPVEFNIEEYKSRIMVKALVEIAPLARKKRDNKYISESSKLKRYPNHKEIKTKENAFDFGSLDQNLTYIYTRDELDNEQKKLRHTTSLSGEFLGYESLFYATGENNKNVANTINFAKKSDDADLYGPLKLREVQLVDFGATSTPLVGGGGILRGVMLSSYNINTPSSFGAKTFTGVLKPGWEVELYQNQILIGRIEEDGRNRYEFKDVILIYGLNRFERIFYGPQGEILKEYENLNINQDMINKPETQYRLYTGIDYQDKRASSISIKKSIIKNSSTEISYNELSLLDEIDTRKYFRIGHDGFIKNLYFSFDYAKQEIGDGEGFEVSNTFPLNTASLKLTHTSLKKFKSGLFNATNIENNFLTRVQRAELRFLIPFTRPITNKIAFREEVFENASNKDFFEHLLTWSGRFLVLINRYEYQRRTMNWTNNPEIRFNIGHTRLSGDLVYQNDRDLVRSGLQLRHSQGLRYSYRAIYRKDHTTNQEDYGLSASKEFSKLRGLLDVFYTPSTDNITLLAGIDFNLSRNLAENNVKVTNRLIARKSSLLVKTFIDMNHNQQFDPEDRLLAGVGVKVLQTNIKKKTNENGKAYFDDLPPHQHLNISMPVEDISNFNLKPLVPGISFWSRAGAVEYIDYPVGYFGEIEGTVYLKDKNNLSGLTNIKIKLIDRKGKVAIKTYTDVEGYFYIERIKPGKYRLEISNYDINKFQPNQKSLAINISSEGGVASEKDFYLTIR